MHYSKQDYLRHIWGNIKNDELKLKVQLHNDHSVSNVQKDIDSEVIVISTNHKNLTLKKKNQNMPLDQKLKQILNQKEQILNRLNMLNMEESKIKQVRQPHLQKSKLRSQLTQQDIARIRELSKAQRKFQKQLKKKDQLYNLRLEQFRLQENELIEKQKQQQCKIKREAIEAHLRQLRQKQKQREENHLQAERLLSEVKSKRLLYQQMQNKWKQLENEEQSRRDKTREQIKKQRNLDHESINDHEAKYKQVLQKQLQQRQKRINQLKSSFQSTELYPASKFYDYVKQEQHNREHSITEKLVLPKIYTEKRLQYAQKVKMEIMPKMKLVHTLQIENKENQIQHKSMSFAELNNLGNDYMKMAKQLLSKNISEKVLEQTTKIKYRDYLKEQKMNRPEETKNELEIIKSIMAKEGSESEKLEKVKNLTKKLEKHANKSSGNLIQSIQAKLELLKQLT